MSVGGNLVGNGTVSYIMVSTDGVQSTTNIKKEFTELRRYFEEVLDIKIQEVLVLKYLILRVFQYPLDFSIYQTDQITELVNE